MKRSILALPLLIILGASACGDDEIVDACGNTCGDSEICDDRNISDAFCVTSCESENSCAGEAPVCNVGENVNAAIGLCVCDETSCSDGLVCLADGTCGEGDPGDPGDPNPADDCENVGEEGCLANQQLCQVDENDANSNQCVEPQAVNGACDNAAAHTRDDDAPIFVGIEFVEEKTPTNDCNAIKEFRLTVALTADGADGTDLVGPNGTGLNANLQPLRENGTTSFTFNAPDLNGPLDNGLYEILFRLCLADPDVQQAIFVTDQSNRDSNAVCFTETELRQ